MIYVARAAGGGNPYNLRLAQMSWVGSVACTDPAQPLPTAGEELDHLYHDLSDLSDLSDTQ